MSDGCDFETESWVPLTAAALELRKVVVVSDNRDFASNLRVLLTAATLGPKVAVMTHDRNFDAKLPVSLTTVQTVPDLGLCRDEWRANRVDTDDRLTG